MRKLLLSAGHSNVEGRDRGAIYKHRVEGELTARVRSDLAHALLSNPANKFELILDINDSILRDTLDAFRDIIKRDDIAIDLHFNNFASNLTVGGTEVIVPENYSKFEFELAQEISFAISNSLGIRNRGVKRESSTALRRLAWKRLGCEAILPEICFLSNEEDMAAFNENYWKMVSRLTIVLEYFIKRP